MLRHHMPRGRSLALAALVSFASFVPVTGHATTLRLRWTAPGNDGSVGTASRYQLFVSPQPITPANYTKADTMPGMPLPKLAGTAQSVTVAPTINSSPLYFAI